MYLLIWSYELPSLLLLAYYPLTMLLVSGDIEPNPGPKIKSLHIIQINARSLKTVDQNKNKLVQFKTLVALKSPHVVSICETWLNKSVKNKDILVRKEYKIFRKDRDIARGGGVFLAISNKLKCKRRKDVESKSPFHNEIIAAEIKQDNGKRIGIVSIYKPPDDLNFGFADNLEHILKSLWAKGLFELIVLGDFNFPEIQWDTGFPRNLGGLSYQVAEILHDHGLVQLNTTPSRTDTDNILDLVLANHPHKVSEIECYRDIITTDHAILDFYYDFNYTPVKTKAKSVFNFRRADFDALNTTLRNSNWDFLDTEDDIDTLVTRWETTILQAANRIIPKTKVRDSNTTPWIDGEIVHLSNKKETKRRKAKRTGSARHWNKYLEYNKRLQDLVHTKFNAYIAGCTDEMANNPKKFWNLVGAKMGDRGYPDTVSLDRETAETDKAKAEMFNQFFGSVFTEPSAQEDLPNVNPIYNPNLEKIILEEKEVHKVLAELDPNKASGPDHIPARILKECAPSLASSLTTILNTSMKKGQFPTNWKIANVCPVFKKGERHDVKNYRPISLLSIASKVFERCVFNRIIPFIQPQLTEAQHGFCSGRSTVTQLLEVYDSISKEIDNRGQVDTIFLDLSKAFDSVSHPHLMIKLQRFGIHGTLLQWFSSYLSTRKQRTTINEELSGLTDVLSGVPQGSILGPLLFLIFINDIPNTVQGSTQIALYADDSKLYRSINSYHDCMDLQDQLDKVAKWSLDWKLNFNATKCKIMSVTRKIQPFHYHYHINGLPLERVNSMNDLGVIIQDNLLWDEHIRNIAAKANRTLFFIKRSIGFHAPFKAKLTLYTSLVRSQLEYGSVIWAPTTKQNLMLLEKVQRKATRYICNYNGMNYRDRLLRTKLIPLASRRETLDCQFAYKARAGTLGEKIQTICSVRPLRHNTRLDKDRSRIQCKLINTETYGHFYSNRLPPIWNKLPEHIRSIPYVPKSSKFKHAIKKVYKERLNDLFNPDSPCTWVTKCRCPTCRT